MADKATQSNQKGNLPFTVRSNFAQKKEAASEVTENPPITENPQVEMPLAVEPLLPAEEPLLEVGGDNVAEPNTGTSGVVNTYEKGKITEEKAYIPKVEVEGAEVDEAVPPEVEEADEEIETAVTGIQEVRQEAKKEAAGEEGELSVGQPGDIVPDGHGEFIKLDGDPKAENAADLEAISSVGRVASEEATDDTTSSPLR